MTILSDSQLAAIRQRNEMERNSPRPSFGYPAGLILDLLQTLDATKKEKKKWQRLATGRGDVLRKAGALINGALEKVEEE